MGDHSDIDHTGLTGVGDVAAHEADTTSVHGIANTANLYTAGGTDVAIADGGTGASTKAAAFDALSPMTTQDDIIIGGASGTGTRLAKGTDGQVLTVDPTTHHLVWATPSGGSGDVATDTIWNAKGDLAVGTGSDTASRLAVGSNGQVLTADSGESTGVKWATPSAGGATDPITEQFGAASTAFEFDTSSLTGLTTFGSPDTVDADTTLQNHLFLKDTNTTWQFCGVYASTPSTPFTAITRLADSWIYQQYNQCGLFVGEASPGKLLHVGHRYDVGGGSGRSFGGYLASSPTDSSGSLTWNNTAVGHVDGSCYLALVVNSTSNIDVYVSLQGRIWFKGASAQNPSATIGSVGLYIQAGSTGSSRTIAAAFEYLRIFNSALTMPGL